MKKNYPFLFLEEISRRLALSQEELDRLPDFPQQQQEEKKREEKKRKVLPQLIV